MISAGHSITQSDIACYIGVRDIPETNSKPADDGDKRLNSLLRKCTDDFRRDVQEEDRGYEGQRKDEDNERISAH